MSPNAQLLEAIARRESLQAELDSAALEVSRHLMNLRWQGTPARDLASMLGVTRQRIYQVLERAERDLRAQYEDERAASYGLATAGPDNRGLASGSFPCQSCGKFKSDPAAVCGQCGDDPVTFNGDRREFNRAYGYAA